MTTPQVLKTLLLARLKLLPALLGFVLFYLQAYQVSSPNHWVSVAIGILTLLGIHQTPNL